MEMSYFLLFLLASAPALENPVTSKLDEERFQYITDDEGNPHLVDLWAMDNDLLQTYGPLYNPDQDNNYILFTRKHPVVGQLIELGNQTSLMSSDFNPRRRTAVIIHGWMNNPTSAIFRTLIPAFLEAEDVNVIMVDWSAGGATINYVAAVANTVTSGKSVAGFITWLNSVSGASLSDYHLAGHSLGAHQVGVVGRNLGGEVAYITALDPALLGWIRNENKFKADDGVYTEVIHTNSGVLGYPTPLGLVDFYPSKGYMMPGCYFDPCSHSRSFEYLAESLTSGGFEAARCGTYWEAFKGNCHEPGSLIMGGLRPKTGETGIFYMLTNASPPFSRG